MSYTEFKAVLKKINLKPKGVKEIVLEVSDGALHGKIDMLSEMLDGRVAIAIDSEIVRYNVQINARTEKPIRTYRVDDQGIVSEVKPEGEQLELELGMAKRPDQVTDIPEEISREVVDEFIITGLAPRPKGFYPLAEWIERIIDGETYLKIAGENGMSSGRIVDLIDEYRQSVAPLAAMWDTWRKEKAERQNSEDREVSEEEEDQDGDESSVSGQDVTYDPPMSDEPDIEMEDGEGQEEAGSGEDALNDWEQSITGGPESHQSDSSEPVDVETFILTEKPQYEDIPFDFPNLLQRRKGGETWMDIAKTLGISSTRLSAAWHKYKNRIKEQRGGAA
jgi:hypothetical protein